MPPTAARTRWSEAQFVLGDDGMPLPRGSTAIEISGTEEAGRKRGRSEPLVGPEFCGPVELTERHASSDESTRGGPAALRRWRQVRDKVDWRTVGVTLTTGQHDDRHRIEPPDAPKRWWHGPNVDQGLEEVTRQAQAKEEKARRGANGGWRREWPALRREQLQLQGQGHLATEERTRPGRPDSVESMVQASESYRGQISFLVREHGWEAWKAEAYTLLACCTAAALGRAERDGGTEYPHSARLVREVLAERLELQTEPAPPAYANLVGPLSLTQADPAWHALCETGGGAPAAPGVRFVTSALALAVASLDCFQGQDKGCQVHTSRGGVPEWTSNDSDVVCFESQPAAEGGPPGSLVSVGGEGYHLPPGATVELVDVKERFKAYGLQVRRRLFTVRVLLDGGAAAARGAAAALPLREANGQVVGLPPPASALPPLASPVAAAAAEEDAADGSLSTEELAAERADDAASADEDSVGDGERRMPCDGVRPGRESPACCAP